MTSRKLTSGFDFSSCGHLRVTVTHDASSHRIWCKDLYPIRSYWHFSEFQDGGRRHVGFSSYGNLEHSGVLIMWRLSCVPNMVQEIDALMLQTFIWWRHAN